MQACHVLPHQTGKTFFMDLVVCTGHCHVETDIDYKTRELVKDVHIHSKSTFLFL